jgi:hypothetical protein
MSRLLLHVGLPKAGSTTLQTVFAQGSGIKFLGKHDARFVDSEIGEFVRVVAPFGDVRLQDISRWKNAFRKHLKQSRDADVILLSDELLSSAGFLCHGQSNSLPQIIDNFRWVLGDVADIEVVIVVREQRKLLKSYFKQWVLNGGNYDYETFVSLNLMRPYRGVVPALNYSSLVNSVTPLVSKVHLLVFERLFSDTAYTRMKLAEMGCSHLSGILRQVHERPPTKDNNIEALLAQRSCPPWLFRPGPNSQPILPDLFAYLGRGFADSKRYQERLEELHKFHSSREANRVEYALQLQPDTERSLERLASAWNRNLHEIDKDTDWVRYGYRVPES